MFEEAFDKDKKYLFINEGCKIGSVSDNYCKALRDLFLQNIDTVSEFIKPDHANAHGTRKGSSIHATSGTTCPPPITSIAYRGESSLEKVLDIYWQWAEARD